jgi:aryl carrier-like protein
MDPKIIDLTIQLLGEVREIHDTDEYTGRCLDGCRACRAAGLVRLWRQNHGQL